MAQDSANIPQADRLEDVVLTVLAVKQGNTSFQEIATFIGKVERQGRYYRLAAQILGLLDNEHNKAQLLPAGDELLRLRDADPRQVNGFLRPRVLAIPVVKAIFDYVQQHPSSTTSDLSKVLVQEFVLTKDMSERRVQTILSWLRELHLIELEVGESSRTYRAAAHLLPDGNDIDQGVGDGTSDDSDFVLEEDAERGLTPNAPSLRTLREVWSGERTMNAVSVQDAVTAAEQLAGEAEEERAQEDAASVRHQALVERMASLLKSREVIPEYNRYIDLYAKVGEASYICEMKSCQEDNLITQARRGLSQLYEYRYLHQMMDAHLVLVLEEEPLGPNRWYINYLVEDRGVLVCWMTPQGSFDCPSTCSAQLRQLLSEG